MLSQSAVLKILTNNQPEEAPAVEWWRCSDVSPSTFFRRILDVANRRTFVFLSWFLQRFLSLQYMKVLSSSDFVKFQEQKKNFKKMYFELNQNVLNAYRDKVGTQY